MQLYFVDYATFKSHVTAVTSPIYYCPQAVGYLVLAGADDYCVEASAITTADITDFETNYKTGASQVGGRDDAMVLSLAARNLPKQDSEHRTIVVQEPPLDGAMVNVVTYNFCDKTTWYQQATAVADETMTDSGDGLTWTSAHLFWIDLTHGKFYLEDKVPSRSNYVPVIKVDGVTKTERTPFATSGGDYVVDYRAGTITFATSQAGKTVTASYRYAGSSIFTVAPASGKYLWVQDSEVQFSVDVIMTETVNFQAFAYNPADPGGPKIPVSSLTNYKCIRDFVDEARGVHPTVPAIGGTARGLQHEHLVFPFKYTQAKELKSSLGVEIRVWISNDVEFEGEFGTATFYCLSYSET